MTQTMLQPMKNETKQVSLQDKFRQLEKNASATFAEREEVVEIAVHALLSKQNVFMLGVPGTAKSALIRYFVEALKGSKSFSKLMGAFTTPEEVFGPVDLKALDEGKTRFVTSGMLPTANIVFLDEVWKSGDGIVNAFLTALNEKVFQNGDKEEKIPMISCFSASNELPANDGLNAIYDRFAFRVEVKPISRANKLAELLTKPTYVAPPEITLEEIYTAHDEIAKVSIPTKVAEALVELVMKLREEGVTISDRTVMRSAADFDPVTGEKLLSIIKVGAWLDGRTECDFEDLKILRHCFWHDPQNARLVAREVNRIADPYSEKALEFGQQAEKILETMNADLAKAADTKRKSQIFMQANQELKKIARRIEREVGAEAGSKKFGELTRLHAKIIEEAQDLAVKGVKGDDGVKKFQRAAPLPQM